jgi:hypothetical protein
MYKPMLLSRGNYEFVSAKLHTAMPTQLYNRLFIFVTTINSD